jgi:peptide deformylase
MMALVRDRDPVLRAPAAPVDPDDPATRVLAERMEATMRARPGGLGLAAPQVGRSTRLVTVIGAATRTRFAGTAFVRDWATIANPELDGDYFAPREVAREGCLSMPGRFWLVPRFTACVVRGLDLRTELEVAVEVTDPLLARLWQHECDHLAGRLISEGGYEEAR